MALKTVLQIEVGFILPLVVDHHPSYPACDCSYVKDANGQEVCTVYVQGSAIMAKAIAEALNEKYATKTPN